MTLNRLPHGYDLCRTIQAAEGWLALGAAEEAWQELDALEEIYRMHPAVLHQSARTLVALGRIKEAKEAVYRLARVAPGWRMTVLDDPALDALWLENP